MDVIDLEKRAERRRELAGLHALTPLPLARAAVRNFVARMPLGGEMRVRLVDREDVCVSREELHALVYDNADSERRKEAVRSLAVVVSLHVSYGEREPHLLFPVWKLRPALYTRDLLRLLQESLENH